MPSPAPRGDGWRGCYTARICNYVPSRRGVAAAGGRGVFRMLTLRMAGAVRHTPRPNGRTPLREGTAGAPQFAIYVPSRRGVAASGGRGVSRMHQTIGASAVRHTPRPDGRTPLREGTAGARFSARIGIYVPSRRGVAAERRSGCVPEAGAVLWLAPCDTPPALRAYPSPRGDGYAVGSVSTSPLGEGWPPSGGRGVFRMQPQRMAGAVRHTPRPAGVPLSERGRLPHAICVAKLYLRPLSERGGRREADGVCPGCNHSVWLAQCDTPPALTGVPLSERGRLARMLYASQIGIYVPSRRGVAAVRRTGCVPDADAA